MKKNSCTVLAALVLALPASVSAAANNSEADVDAMAIYNQGAAVIQDSRESDLAEGVQQIDWPLSGRLRPDTLWLDGGGVRLIGLNARSNNQPDSGSALLAARIGEPVTLLREAGDGSTTARQATLAGLDGDSALVRIGDRIERLTDASPWRLAWPAGEGTKTGGLQLDIDADDAGAQKLTATYQIDGPSWQASYTGRFDPKANKLSLQSMAVIDNSGGAPLSAKKAWLVAGEVARANGGGPRPVMMMERSQAKAADSAPEAAGDTYRYALDDGLDVPAGAIRAVSILAPVSFDAKRSYRFESNWYANSRDQRSHAEVRLTFRNTADVPLPAGVVRVYDGQRAAGLMGEDRIDNTPKGAPVKLVLGQSFDITGERHIVADEKTDDGKSRQRTLELTLYNAAKQKANVDVIEHLPDAAKIVSASTEQQDDKKEANTANWQLAVPAGGKTELHYTVEWPARNR